MTRAEGDPGLQHDLYTAASLSILVWINLFVWTYRKFIIDPDGTVRQCRTAIETHVPYVTWTVQDRHIKEIENAVNVGYELLTDKSRDMGATWDHVAVLHHQWLFRPDRNFLEISRKQDSVDTFGKAGEGGSDPGTLLGKHDYINKWLPDWMLTNNQYHRIKLHLVNLVNGSRIDGESAGANAGSSDRRTAILLDEMAKMEEGESIKRSTKDVTACRLANSTQNGPGTAFAKWSQSGQIKVFPLMYFEHPEKGLGRYVVENTTYPHLGPWLIRSPWFDKQEKERSPKEMAIEILADPIGSGETYFEARNVETHRTLHARKCRTRWSVDFRKTVTAADIPKIIARVDLTKVRARRSAKGALRVWPHLIDGRLDQTKTYVIGGDVSKGQGASNSTLSVTCAETREKVAEWADANTPPYDFARIACALALWVGGASRGKGARPLLIWEANGPGWDFGRQVVKTYQYPNYYRDRQTGTVGDAVTKKYGWHATNDKKDTMLGMLRRAYAHGGFVNHSAEALTEALTYVYYDGGGIGPASLVEESASARKTHGDRVISDGLCLWALDGKAKPKHPDGGKCPPNCMEGRRKERLLERKRAARHKTFDYTNKRTPDGEEGRHNPAEDAAGGYRRFQAA